MTFVILHFKIREFTWQSTLSKHSAYIRETFARGNSLCWTVTVMVLWPSLSRSGHTLTASSDGVPLRVLEGSGGLWALQLWQCSSEENCSKADMEHAQGARKGLRERDEVDQRAETLSVAALTVQLWGGGGLSVSGSSGRLWAVSDSCRDALRGGGGGGGLSVSGPSGRLWAVCDSCRDGLGGGGGGGLSVSGPSGRFWAVTPAGMV
jgi:hypothetical protein